MADQDLEALNREKRAELDEFLRSLGIEGEKARATAAYSSGGAQTGEMRDTAAAIAEGEARGTEYVRASHAREEEKIKRAKALRKAQNIQNWASTGLGIIGGTVGALTAGPAGAVVGFRGGAALGTGVGKVLGAGFAELMTGEGDLDPTALNEIVAGISILNEPTLRERMTEMDDIQRDLKIGPYDTSGDEALRRLMEWLSGSSREESP